MEADLLTIYGPALPDDWREQRTVSSRRLLVILRHLPPSSAVGRVLGEWTVDQELLDNIRMAVLSVANRTADPHPDRPLAKYLAAQQAKRAARREKKRAESAARERDRKKRLTEGGNT